MLKPLSYVTSAGWGFAAAASTSDLQEVVPRRCGTKTTSDDPACDTLRKHDASTWLADNAAVILLTVVPLGAAWVLVRRLGRPK